MRRGEGERGKAREGTKAESVQGCQHIGNCAGIGGRECRERSEEGSLRGVGKRGSHGKHQPCVHESVLSEPPLILCTHLAHGPLPQPKPQERAAMQRRPRPLAPLGHRPDQTQRPQCPVDARGRRNRCRHDGTGAAALGDCLQLPDEALESGICLLALPHDPDVLQVGEHDVRRAASAAIARLLGNQLERVVPGRNLGTSDNQFMNVALS